MRRKTKLFGLPLTVLCWVTVTSFAWEQTIPPDIRQTGSGPVEFEAQCATCPSGAVTSIQVLNWNGNEPDLVSIRVPGAPEAVQTRIDPLAIRASTWEELYTDDDGWIHGRASTPSAGGAIEYDAAYRTDSEGTRVRFNPVGDPDRVVETRVSNVELAGLGWIVIYISILILSCAAAHALAQIACGIMADVQCVRSGGVRSSRYRGLCGVGECLVQCNRDSAGGTPEASTAE